MPHGGWDEVGSSWVLLPVDQMITEPTGEELIGELTVANGLPTGEELIGELTVANGLPTGDALNVEWTFDVVNVTGLIGDRLSVGWLSGSEPGVIWEAATVGLVVAVVDVAVPGVAAACNAVSKDCWSTDVLEVVVVGVVVAVVVGVVVPVVVVVVPVVPIVLVVEIESVSEPPIVPAAVRAAAWFLKFCVPKAVNRLT
jgi:hypothetical protein